MEKEDSQIKATLSSPIERKEREDPWNQLVIDLDAVQSNYRYLRSRLPKDCTLYAVLKSDAYGHGIIEVGNALTEAGCQHFAVDSPQEGIQLRKQGVTGEILLLNPIPEWISETAVFHDLSVSIIHPSILQPLETAAEEMDKTCKIHLNVNVGLNRLGISPSKLLKIAREAFSKPHLQVEGLYAQPRDPGNAKESFRKICKLYEKMQSEGVAPKRLHFANSTTFLAHPEMSAGGVRLGILLYGVLPPEQFASRINPLPIKPAMTLNSRIIQMRVLPKGSKIGYRANQKIVRDTVIATIPIGYAHGLDRKLVKSSGVLIKGQRAPFIGAISMNNATVDVTNILVVEIGDLVTVVGKQGKSEISINELAAVSGTISAELMMRFGRGVARHYKSKYEHKISKVCVQLGKSADDIYIQYIQTEKELPEWINIHKIIDFLCTYLPPFDERISTIRSAIDFALSTDYDGNGFVLIATANRKILGVVVSIRNKTMGFIPENVLVYVCVHRDYRNMGLGSRLVREAIKYVDGDVKIHVKKQNPAVKLYRQLGFEDDYLEMRYRRGGYKNEH